MNGDDDLIVDKNIRATIMNLLSELHHKIKTEGGTYLICGSIAWFTDQGLLNKLRELTPYVYLIVNEEDFWGNGSHFYATSQLYKKMCNKDTEEALKIHSPLRCFESVRRWLPDDEYVRNVNYIASNCEHNYQCNNLSQHDVNIDSCFTSTKGGGGGGRRGGLMHTKYLTVLQFSSRTPYCEYKPICVIHGSFNWTKNANNHIENIEISIREKKVMHYFNTWLKLLPSSVPIWV